jgi:hypothetical protein
MKKQRSLLITLLLISASLFSHAQKIDSVLSALSASLPVEKIYIHYDKEYYVAGETIWFKAYLCNDGKPDGISSNLYVQFVDANGQLISSGRYPVMGAVTKGSIVIPDSLPQGNYYIRALTPNMLNGEEDFIYKKNLFIYRPSATTATVVKPQQIVSLQFFPESGHLIDGILTVVGFKANDQWGIPVEAHGIIKTDDGTTVAPFHRYHDGIGKVQFKPIAGKKYLAEMETSAGKRTFSLPDVETSGINLKIQDEKGGKKFQLSRGNKEKVRFETVLLVVQINNHVVNEFEIAFEDYPSVIGHILTDSLPSGILHFTVFTMDRLPVAERVSFVDNGEYKAHATILPVTASFEKRASNSLELIFFDSLQYSCSVSVTDISGGSFGDEDNIWSRFLLTSDLKGYIYNPAWYFRQQNDSVKQALDNLMLTHGWSRFNWTKLFAGQYPQQKYIDQDLIAISGKVVDERNKQSLSYGQLNVLLEAADSSQQTIELPLDEKGRFARDSMYFTGNSKLFYGYLDKNGKQKPGIVEMDTDSLNYIINHVPKGLEGFAGIKNPFNLINKEELNNRFGYVKAERDEKIKELANVNIQAKSSKKPVDAVNEKYTTGVFRAPGKVTLDNINEPANDRAMNVVDYIKNRIPQLTLQGGTFVNRKNFSLASGRNWVVGIFLNEIPTDINQLRILRADDVALVKFYEAGFVGVGSGSPGGALAVYTKEKSNKDLKPEKLEYIEAMGYAITKEFYSPDYSTPDPRHIMADQRSTLYWNPDVITDGETKVVKLKFFNNDFSRMYKVVVEGFDATGKLVHVEKVIGQ